jgi:hypothetical protein
MSLLTIETINTKLSSLPAEYKGSNTDLHYIYSPAVFYLRHLFLRPEHH